jgi:hypothetical protein
MRLFITLAIMLAFGLQSYITQTHIHLGPDSPFASYSKLDTQKSAQQGKEQQPDKFPSNGDPANCPICQEILHSGQFVTPSAAVLFVPTIAVSVITLVSDITVEAQNASHAWRSRAPPKA